MLGCRTGDCRSFFLPLPAPNLLATFSHVVLECVIMSARRAWSSPNEKGIEPTSRCCLRLIVPRVLLSLPLLHPLCRRIAKACTLSRPNELDGLLYRATFLEITDGLEWLSLSDERPASTATLVFFTHSQRAPLRQHLCSLSDSR